MMFGLLLFISFLFTIFNKYLQKIQHFYFVITMIFVGLNIFMIRIIVPTFLSKYK